MAQIFHQTLTMPKNSLAKVINHRIEKLSTLLDVNESQSNVTNINEISIQRENSISNASYNSSSPSTIKVEPLSMPNNPKRSKVNSSNNQNIYEAINSSQMNIHKRIHSKQKRFACDQCPKTGLQNKYDNLITT